MNILIDARLMKINKNGPSSYAKNVLLNIAKVDDRNRYTLLVNREYSDFIKTDNFHVIATDIKPYRLREHWAIPGLIKGRQFDLYHCMQYISPLFITHPTVLTVYDTMHMEKSFWDGSPTRRLLGSYARVMSKLSVKKTVGVVTISHYSAIQISKEFDYNIENIYPIHLGVAPQYFNRIREADHLYSLKKWGIKGPYLLCIGNMRPYKNIETLIIAFSQIVSEGVEDINLVLAGKASDEDILLKQKMVSSLGIADKTMFIKNIDEEDLVKLMGGANIFIFPSKNEGFGLPLIEAIATGAPCIASDIEVFRELCGDSVFYFSPFDTFTLKEKIKVLLSSDILKKQIISQSVVVAKKYSWENTAIKTIKMYEDLYKKTKK